MELGGIDTDIRSTCDFERALHIAASAILVRWPQGVIEDPDTSALLAPADLIGGGRHEVFVFRDRPARDSWTEHGWTRDNANLMIHLLAFPDGIVTCVVEDPQEPELRVILDGVREAVAPAGVSPSRRFPGCPPTK